MVDFDEVVVMREKFLRELNIAIDKVIKEKESMALDYDLMEKALGSMVKNIKSIDKKLIEPITPIKKEEILKVTLDFFKSVDSELHKKSIDTILQQNDNIKMNIYNRHVIKNFEKRDESGIPEYTVGANVHSRNGHATVHIPTKRELWPKEEKLLNKDEGTLFDLYTIVHEISHLFDLDLEFGKPDKEELEGGEEKRKTRITREIFGEATAIAFESMLSEYLLANGIYSKETIKDMEISNINSYLNDARLAYAKLVLAREKTENGEITLEFVENFMREQGFSVQYIRRMANKIINDPRDMLFEKKYALGGLIAPTIIKKYKKEGVGTLKRYLEEAKKENFAGVMAVLGIELNEQGINQLVVNMKERIRCKRKRKINIIES